MTREELIKELAISKYGSVRAFANQIGISYTTLMSMLQRGIGKAGVDKVLKICHALNISADEFSEDKIENNHISTIYNKLDDERKNKVWEYANKQFEEQNHNNIQVSERDEVPRGADEAISVSTDSMEPKIHDGSIQFIHYQPALDFDGEIMLVDIDGQGVTCREVHCEKNKDRLVALNPKYDDIIVPADKVHIIGKVIF